MEHLLKYINSAVLPGGTTEMGGGFEPTINSQIRISESPPHLICAMIV
jgi:hypothetical protein